MEFLTRAKILHIMDTYVINTPLYYGDKSMNILGNEDFYTHISCSYKDKMIDQLN